MWLLAHVTLWSGWEESLPLSRACVAVAQQGIKNAVGHLRMIVAAHCGMFRVLNQIPPRHNLQCMAPKLSPGYECELLMQLSLKNAICSDQLHNCNAASFETRRNSLINICWISCSPTSLFQMGVLHTEWRVNGLDFAVSLHEQTPNEFTFLY